MWLVLEQLGLWLWLAAVLPGQLLGAAAREAVALVAVLLQASGRCLDACCSGLTSTNQMQSECGRGVGPQPSPKVVKCPFASRRKLLLMMMSGKSELLMLLLCQATC